MQFLAAGSQSLNGKRQLTMYISNDSGYADKGCFRVILELEFEVLLMTNDNKHWY